MRQDDMTQTALASRERGLRRAIEAAGSFGRLARLVGVSQQTVSRWQRIPAERVLQIEELTGVAREHLRPDLYQPRIGRPTR
jgi:DNA-binding transcriptional regulator YdaS (Cro superfamily)